MTQYIPGMKPSDVAGKASLPAIYAKNIRAEQVGLEPGASAKDRLMAKVHAGMLLTAREREGYTYLLEKTKQLRAQHRLWQWGVTVTLIPYNVCINNLTLEQLEELSEAEELPPGITPARLVEEMKERKRGQGMKSVMEQRLR